MDDNLKFKATVIGVVIIVLVLLWFINLGVNAVVEGQKKVDLYQQYIYNN